jgi:HD-like signal output (HDOD) protein/CheY-like chemotaxis protein
LRDERQHVAGSPGRARRRILFVDDDPQVTAALENRLRKDRERWAMEFVTSGAAAVAAFTSAAVDIIVCDMRMPGMDGVALLEQIKDFSPETTRIVLSGQAEHEAIVRALPFVHQFLSKPCDANVLRTVLENACNLQDRVANDRVMRIIGRVDRLPSLPDIHRDLVAALARSNVSTAELAAIIERDPSMTSKILQLVNSAFFGIARRISSIQQALMYLGIDLVKGLTLTARVFEGHDAIHPMFVARFQKHSLMTAQLARRLVVSTARRDEAFTAALVHDIGELVLALAYPAHSAQEPAPATLRAAAELRERERFGATHAEVGAYLLGTWGLPATIVDAVAFHREPGRAAVDDAELLAVVHVADALTRELVDGEERSLDMTFLERVGLAGRLAGWEALGREQFAMLTAPH